MQTVTRAKAMPMTSDVVAAIKAAIGEHLAERGGILGRDASGGITHFTPDTTGRCTAGAYDPDLDKMNEQIRLWKTQGITFCGFVHSHPAGITQLSAYDRWYAGEILAAFTKLEELWLPLVMTIPNTGRFQILPYAALPGADNRKQITIVPANLLVDGVLSNGQELASPLEYQGLFPDVFDSLRQTGRVDWQAVQGAEDRRNSYLARIDGAFDLRLLDEIRLVVIGLGGSASLVRNCARMGFGEYVLIDFDTVTPSNIGSQQAHPTAIGRSKASTLAADVREINPASAVLAVNQKIENISDGEFERFLTAPLRASPGADRFVWDQPIVATEPEKVLLLVLTDDFHAQARGHRLGLHFGLPTICAQEYRDGLGAEVTYTVPGITPACHRCITSSRYQAYLNGYRNDVTSRGAPIFGAEFLNAVLGHMVMAMALHDYSHPHWGNIIRRLGDRNLIRVRMHPDFDAHFGDTFARRHQGASDQESLFMLDSLFLPQTPDCGQAESRPICPDCGGTGNLLDARGTFHDTRDMSCVPARTVLQYVPEDMVS